MFMRVHLKRAAGLKATDTGLLQSGKADPYVVVRAGGQEKRSQTHKATCDPLFDEYFDFEGGPDAFVGAPLRLDVFDADLLSKQALGSCEVELVASEIEFGPRVSRPKPFRAPLLLEGVTEGLLEFS
eukprot:1770649-Prymnesium_polylepis.1